MNSLKLRPLQEKDAQFMLEWMCSPDVGDYFRFNSKTVTEESVLAFIRDTDESNKHFAIADDNDEYIGTVSLKNIDTVSLNAEFAIALRSKARGRGIGSFAVREILKYAFCELNLHKVYLNVYADNTAAIKLYEKSGFVIEGEFREHVQVKGKLKNLKWFGITKKEYEAYDNN